MPKVIGYGSWIAYALGVHPERLLTPEDTLRAREVAHDLFKIISGKSFRFVIIPSIKRYFNPEIARSPNIVRDKNSKEIGVMFDVSDSEMETLSDFEGGIEERKEITVTDAVSGEDYTAFIFLPAEKEDIENDKNFELIEYQGWLGKTKEEMEKLSIDYLDWLKGTFPEATEKLLILGK